MIKKDRRLFINKPQKPAIKNLIFPIFFLLFFDCVRVSAGNITVIAPYYGTENNTYVNSEYGLNLEDSAAFKGLYLQSVNPEKHQWNLFLYRTDNINYSDLNGFNFICDYYFGKSHGSKNVAGVGMNYLKLDMKGEQVPTAGGPLDAFDLDMDICSFYARVGKYYNYDRGKFNFRFMPWAGGQLNHSRGKGTVDYPGPGKASFKIDNNRYYWITGLNFKADYCHFLQFEAKHCITFDQNDFYHKTTVMVNVFLTRNLGLSYRYNHQETCAGKDSYNLFGIAAVF